MSGRTVVLVVFAVLALVAGVFVGPYRLYVTLTGVGCTLVGAAMLHLLADALTPAPRHHRRRRR